ncbi:MAG: cysteine--tRNA ligase [bacterium]
MKIYDTLSQELKEFKTIEENKIKIYVCGPTVYDFPHLGHARCYITWDMVVRYFRFKGYEVTYVRNVTDVDDKIINKAKANSLSIEQIADTYYNEFKEAMAKLNIASPDIEPRATETIDEMINITKILIDKGLAYTSNGDVYFKVGSYPNYGRLSKQNLDDLRSGARVESSEIKEDPMDFTLWKAVKSQDEPGWESPWGKGRPGWHIECSAMIKKHLGETIDIHAGGQDLVFPHHENEKAQSEAAFDKPFAKYWMHNGFVIIGNEKMSKSLNNFVTINDVLEKYDSNAIRLFILTNNYRMPIEFNDESLKAAKSGVKRLLNAYTDVSNVLNQETVLKAEEFINIITDEMLKEESIPFCKMDALVSDELKEELLANIIKQIKLFINSMDEDFNTSKALAVLFEVASLAQKAKDKKLESALYLALLIKLSSVLGFELNKTSTIDNALTEKLMDFIISLRKDVRAEKNWALSDKIRDGLKDIGVTLKDTKEGTTWTIDE